MLRVGARRAMTSSSKVSSPTSRLASISRHMSSTTNAKAAPTSNSSSKPADEVRLLWLDSRSSDILTSRTRSSPPYYSNLRTLLGPLYSTDQKL